MGLNSDSNQFKSALLDLSYDSSSVTGSLSNYRILDILSGYRLQCNLVVGG